MLLRGIFYLWIKKPWVWDLTSITHIKFESNFCLWIFLQVVWMGHLTIAHDLLNRCRAISFYFRSSSAGYKRLRWICGRSGCPVGRRLPAFVRQVSPQVFGFWPVPSGTFTVVSKSPWLRSDFNLWAEIWPLIFYFLIILSNKSGLLINDCDDLRTRRNWCENLLLLASVAVSFMTFGTLKWPCGFQRTRCLCLGANKSSVRLSNICTVGLSPTAEQSDCFILKCWLLCIFFSYHKCAAADFSVFANGGSISRDIKMHTPPTCCSTVKQKYHFSCSCSRTWGGDNTWASCIIIYMFAPHVTQQIFLG